MDIEDLKKITVIGAGDMGHGIAEVAIIADFNVVLNDIKQEFLDNAVNKIRNSLEKLVSKNKIAIENIDNTLEKLEVTLDLEKAVKEADLVIEAVPEIMTLKKEIFQKIDTILPAHSIIASNTSNMSITELGKITNRPDKVVGLHFFNPAIIMKLVEVIKGKNTSEKTMDLMVKFVKKLKKVPVKVLKDSPGFIVNRVTAPVNILLGKIIDLNIEEPGRVDITLREKGMAMGPFELADFVGLDIMSHSMEYFQKTLSPDYEVPKWLKEKIKKNELGKKTGKGIYDWSKGRPDLSKFKPSDKIEIEDLIAIQVNEASKLLENGIVANARIIDKAIINGTGNKAGVINLAKSFGLDKMAKRCEKLADQFNIDVFRPTKTLREGKIK
ncbi:MAG: 3-hydroxyacyl-CoA dehydrogenase NAD-binding domain-containing protein [Candidatus Helarchaeota archaeon]